MTSTPCDTCEDDIQWDSEVESPPARCQACCEDKPAAKWNQPYDQECLDRWKENSRWSLEFLVGRSYYWVGAIEKPYGGDRYYLDQAPPTEADLEREKKAFADGLHICYQHTEEFRATLEHKSFETLDEAKRALIHQVRKQELGKMKKANRRYESFLDSMAWLDKQA
jgi:hypothetical protein